jgi:pimeloyl-ACP methyl ester carboxylesterase
MARIMLIHGAFGNASCWDRVVPGLRHAGHTVEAIDLPGAGSDPTPVADVTLDAYAQKVCEALAAGPAAVLVGHSMGGMVITEAAARCPEHVAQLVYVAAFLPADGQSLLDITHLPEAAGDAVQSNMVVEGEPPVAVMPVAAARDALHGSCDDEQAAFGIECLGPQPVVPFTQPVQLGGAASAPRPPAYVMCLRDRAVLPALQRRMVEAAGCDPVIELDTDHCPWASCPQDLSAALNQIAGRPMVAAGR